MDNNNETAVLAAARRTVKGIVNGCCHNVVDTLDIAFLNYFLSPEFETENNWAYGYFVSGDAWYWYNINYANAAFNRLPPEVKQRVDFARLARCPDSFNTIFREAENN
jgi:hypothetical protein